MSDPRIKEDESGVEPPFDLGAWRMGVKTFRL